MKTIVISQPHFLPWRGFFELRRLADRFVYYDDVPYPQGKHLLSRVKIRTPQDSTWLTVPIKRASDTLIKDVLIDNDQNWKRKHLASFSQFYKPAPHFQDSLQLMEKLYEKDCDHLCDLTIESTELIHEYLGFQRGYSKTSNFKIETGSSKSEHVINMVKFFEADTILSAWGALNFYDFDLFEKNGVRVEFIKYSKVPYPQVHGGFNPFVSTIDLVANCGKNSAQSISAETEYWKTFITTPEAKEYLGR